MILSEQHIIKKSNPLYQELDMLCFLSKNLYNLALYSVRQHYFETGKFLGKFELIKNFTKEKQKDFKKLTHRVAQQIIFQVEQDMRSFFALLKLKQKGQYQGKVKLPKYKEKQGRNVAIFEIMGISGKELKKGIIKFGGMEINKKFVPLVKRTIKTKQSKVQQVRIIPKNGYYTVEVLYKVESKQKKEDNQKYLSIDLGINNLATLTSNVTKPIIVNGKPVKSINQFYNKTKAKLSSQLETVNKTKSSKRTQSLSLKRNNKIKDYFHKTSRFIVNHAISNDLNTIIIGKNQGWKQDTNLGRVNNQKFVSIPFNNLIQMISYKAELQGIKVIVREESYTSQASFLDNDFIPKYGDKEIKEFSGKRIKRGLYQTKNGRLINADVNGSLNIMKKEVPNALNGYGIEVCSTPLVVGF